MPELPEVETTRRGIEPHLKGATISAITIYNPALRWPIPGDLASKCQGQQVTGVSRRAKYILLHLQTHSLLIHLGMSGSLRLVGQRELRKQHDHVDIQLSNRTRLLFNDPRRFGCMLICQQAEVLQHKLLMGLGPEPLTPAFDGNYLYRLAKNNSQHQTTQPTKDKPLAAKCPDTKRLTKRKGQRSKGRVTSVKSFIMDQQVVVGVGNIYANEALFRSSIHPARRAGNISQQRYIALAKAIKHILHAAIDKGGTTLRDFVGGDGKPGYFQQTLMVYGRGGQPCHQCKHTLKEIRLAQRSTVFCPVCQR